MKFLTIYNEKPQKTNERQFLIHKDYIHLVADERSFFSMKQIFALELSLGKIVMTNLSILNFVKSINDRAALKIIQI